MPKALIHCCDSAYVNYNFCKHCLLAWYTQPLHVLCRAHCINLWNGKPEGRVWPTSSEPSLRAWHWQNCFQDKPIYEIALLETQVSERGATSSKTKTLHLHLRKNTLFVKTVILQKYIQQSCTQAQIPSQPKRTWPTQTSKATMIYTVVFSPCIKHLSTVTTISIYQCL